MEQSRDLVHMARKVDSYKRDILDPADLSDLRCLTTNLHQLRKNRLSRLDTLQDAYNALDALLRRFGGHIYPVTFLSENIEMIVVAAIVALGIRAFFIQTFKIPTNSMYPTYSGMLPHVYALGEKVDRNPLEKFWSLLADGAQHYSWQSTADGKLSIPFYPSMPAIGDFGPAYFQMVPGRKWLVLPAQYREYVVFIDKTPVSFRVPRDFSLDDVIHQTFFPQYRTLDEALKVARDEGRLVKTESGAMLLKTDFVFKKGDAIVQFDILTGDMLFVDRISYHFRQPKVGEAIVFRTGKIPAMHDDKYYIKRLVGLPGDVLSIEEPVLYRNHEPINGVAAFDKNNTREGLYPGYVAAGRLAKGFQETVPPHSFYALGDNSPHSGDGRYWGFVPEKEVVGHAILIVHPFSSRWGLAH